MERTCIFSTPCSTPLTSWSRSLECAHCWLELVNIIKPFFAPFWDKLLLALAICASGTSMNSRTGALLSSPTWKGADSGLEPAQNQHAAMLATSIVPGMLQLFQMCSRCTWYDTAVSGIFQLYLVHLICTCWYATTIQGMLQHFQVNSSCTWYTSSVLGIHHLYLVCSNSTRYATAVPGMQATIIVHFLL